MKKPELSEHITFFHGSNNMRMMASQHLSLMMLLFIASPTDGQHGFQELNITRFPHIIAEKPQVQKICNNGKCFTIRNAMIEKYYNGLFHTPAEIKKQLTEWTGKHREEFQQSALNPLLRSFCKVFKRIKLCRNFQTGSQDYDICCPSTMNNFDNISMPNIAGKLKVIAHLKNPERRQFIPYASCISKGACFEGLGVCQTDTISMWLLVFDFSCWPPFKFDQFSIPAYCSCKSRSLV